MRFTVVHLALLGAALAAPMPRLNGAGSSEVAARDSAVAARHAVLVPSEGTPSSVKRDDDEDEDALDKRTDDDDEDEDALDKRANDDGDGDGDDDDNALDRRQLPAGAAAPAPPMGGGTFGVKNPNKASVTNTIGQNLKGAAIKAAGPSKNRMKKDGKIVATMTQAEQTKYHNSKPAVQQQMIVAQKKKLVVQKAQQKAQGGLLGGPIAEAGGFSNGMLDDPTAGAAGAGLAGGADADF